jgi:hypothetical protein
MIEETNLGTNRNGEAMTGLSVRATRDPQLSNVSDTALLALDAVHRYFRNIGSKQISDLSHKEEGYRATRYKEAISYQYADALKVDPIAKLDRLSKVTPTKRRLIITKTTSRARKR